jgi:plastocyanin
MTVSARVLALTVTLAATAAACGSSTGTPSASATTSTSPSGSAQVTTVVIKPGGIATPNLLTIKAGTQVTFTNNDTVSHLMFSDPHPEHTDCPEINTVGYLAPGQSLQTDNLNTVRTCGFHDHNMPDVASLHGSITIQ